MTGKENAPSMSTNSARGNDRNTNQQEGEAIMKDVSTVASGPAFDQEKTIDEVVAPFDLPRVQDITAQAGLTLQFTSTPERGDPDDGLWQIEVSGAESFCLVITEWISGGIWGVYVGDMVDGELNVAQSVEFAADVVRAGQLAEHLNEAVSA